MANLTLSDLIDLEVQVQKEEHEDRRDLRARYRSMGQSLMERGVPARDSAALLRGALGQSSPRPTAGRQFTSALAWVRTALVVAGILLGWGLATQILTYKGEHPVNVVHFLVILVGLQLLFLVFLAVTLIPRRRGEWFPGDGPLQGLVRSLFHWMIRNEETRTLVQDLAARRHAYKNLERWLLIQSTQFFGVAFNLAALAGCFYGILFSDIAFGWSTTLQWDPSRVHQLAGAASAPGHRTDGSRR